MVATGEVADECGFILMVPKGSGSHLQARDPSLGPVGQGVHVIQAQFQIREGLQEGPSFLDLETQIFHPQLVHLTTAAQAGNREGRIGAGGDQDVRLGRQMIDQVSHPVVYGLILDEMIVIENEQGLSRRLTHLVDQGDQDPFLDFTFRKLYLGERGDIQGGNPAFERGKKVTHEPDRVVITLVQ